MKEYNPRIYLSFILKPLFLFLFSLITIVPNAFSQNNHYEIYALKFGERNFKEPLSNVAVGANGNDSVNVWFMYWLLKGDNEKIILVDAGFTEDAGINPKFITYSRPDKMLEKLNIKPADITDIIITHPHWDHIGGIDL